MPSKATTAKAKGELRAGHSPTTAAGEFVHEEMHHMKRANRGRPRKATRKGAMPKRAKRSGVKRTAARTARPGGTGTRRNRNTGRGGTTRTGRSR